MRYRKKPVVIEAFEMTEARGGDHSEWPEWLHAAWNKDPTETGAFFVHVDQPRKLALLTLEGPLTVAWGAFIIQGVRGELYACRADIFWETYGKADEETIGIGSPLEHADLAAPPLHIPDGEGGCYKTELVIERSKDRVVKIQWWHAPDPRRDPHNHPWSFRSTILSGGYIETRYRLSDGGVLLPYKETSYRKGAVNEMPADVFHTVDKVSPGTVTRMVTGPIGDGDWGYLIDGKYVSAKDDPYPNADFFTHLCALNPHKRP